MSARLTCVFVHLKSAFSGTNTLNWLTATLMQFKFKNHWKCKRTKFFLHLQKRLDSDLCKFISFFFFFFFFVLISYFLCILAGWTTAARYCLSGWRPNCTSTRQAEWVVNTFTVRGGGRVATWARPIRLQPCKCHCANWKQHAASQRKFLSPLVARFGVILPSYKPQILGFHWPKQIFCFVVNVFRWITLMTLIQNTFRALGETFFSANHFFRTVVLEVFAGSISSFYQKACNAVLIHPFGSHVQYTWDPKYITVPYNLLYMYTKCSLYLT